MPQGGVSVDKWNAIEVYGLKKNFGGSNGCCGRSVVCSGAYDCCSCRAMKRCAVEGLPFCLMMLAWTLDLVLCLGEIPFV